MTNATVKVQNSPEFHLRFGSCRGAHIDNLSICSPALSPNTDSIHVENTQDILITNTVVSNGNNYISSGDVCVPIVAGTLKSTSRIAGHATAASPKGTRSAAATGLKSMNSPVHAAQRRYLVLERVGMGRALWPPVL